VSVPDIDENSDRSFEVWFYNPSDNGTEALFSQGHTGTTRRMAEHPTLIELKQRRRQIAGPMTSDTRRRPRMVPGTTSPTFMMVSVGEDLHRRRLEQLEDPQR